MGDSRPVKKLYPFLTGLLSFCIPILIFALGYYNIGIYPGSENLVLSYDLKNQLLPLYSYISRGGPGFDNNFYSMTGCLGGAFFGTVALYISPLDFVYAIVPIRLLPDAIYLMVLLRIGLCGLFFSFFSYKNGKVNLSFLPIVLLSCSYALMSYCFMYFVSPMWLDGVMLFPLLALGTERIIRGQKSVLFIFLLSFCFIGNYYTGYMMAIAITMYFLFRLAEEGYGKSEIRSKSHTFILSGILSAGLSMAVLIPVFLDFTRGKFSENGMNTDGVIINNTPLEVLRSLMPQNFSGFDVNAAPNIYCGSLVLLLALFWLAVGKNKKGRVAAGMVLIIYFLSFIFGPLDRIWHGFRDPVNFSVRYAFTFVFFVMCLAMRGVETLGVIKFKMTLTMRRFVIWIMCIYGFAELYINGSFILAKIGTECSYGIRIEYDKYCSVSEGLIPYDRFREVSGYGRLMTNYKYTSYDGAFFGYDGLSRFSSSYNLRLSDFLRSLGIGSIYQTTTEYGLTPPVLGLFGGKYYISYWVDQTDFYNPVKRYDAYTLYDNPNALPLAFEMAGYSEQVSCEEFTEDPYRNIDIIFLELFGDGQTDTDVFKEQAYTQSENFDPAIPDGIRSIRDYTIIPFETAHYYMFGGYVVDDYPGSAESNTFRFCKLDDNDTCVYGDRKYSFCTDIGLLKRGSVHNLTLYSSNDDLGMFSLYYYDRDTYEKIAKNINGFEMMGIGSAGIEFRGTVDNDSYVFISLPYEPGYRVYVDGVKTKYSSYRNIFMTVPVNSGDHIIRISFIPDGLITGLIISGLSMVMVFFYVVKERIKMK